MNMLEKETRFELRHSVERLRMGLFDPVAVRFLTMDEKRLLTAFNSGLKKVEAGEGEHLCICGAYGQGKSHALGYLRDKALAQGFAVSTINLDLRELPFHQYRLVFRAIIKNLILPDSSDFLAVWATWAKEQLHSNKKLLPAELLPLSLPHRYRMILLAYLQKTISLTSEQKQQKKHREFKPKEFSSWLQQAFYGENLPLNKLKSVFKYRQLEGYAEQSLSGKGPVFYLAVIAGLGQLLRLMGYKGWVLLFDEAESIAQLRLQQRAQSYGLLDQFFTSSFPGIYSIFAFTEDFFTKLNAEDYHTKRFRGEQALSVFADNYAVAWRKLNRFSLQDFSAQEWQGLQTRLIELYRQAYQTDSFHPQITNSLEKLLESVRFQETRFKLKALVQHLDIQDQQRIFDDK